MSSDLLRSAGSDSGGAAGPLLEARGVHREFRLGPTRIHILRGVELTLKWGEIAAVTGASGAGKSTLLHILGGLDQPTAGSVRFEGREIFALAEGERDRFRNRHLGFVFQFHHLLPEFSAEENVMMPGLIARQSRQEARGRARVILEEVGLGERVEHKPSELSGGEQQRVALARALYFEPKLILADEPTGNLDPETARGLHRLMYTLARKHRQSWIVVTHNAELAEQADTRWRLAEGVLRPGGGSVGDDGEEKAHEVPEL